MSEKNWNDLPLQLQLEIIQLLDTKSKLQLARVCQSLREVVLSVPARVVWSEVEVTVTSGERTLPFLAKVSLYARAMVAHVGSDVFGREGSLPVFPALTHLDICGMNNELHGLLTPALLSAFPSLRNLRLDSRLTENIVRDLPSMFPVRLTCLTIDPNVSIVSSETVTKILSSFPALAQFTLEGPWGVGKDEPPGAYETVLQALGRLQKASVYNLEFSAVTNSSHVRFIDKLAESSIAQGVKTLKIDMYMWENCNAKFTPTVSPLRFSSLSTLNLYCYYDNQLTSLSNWLAAMRGLETLETLRLCGRCSGSAGGPACLWDDPSGECLPRRLSTIVLEFWYGEVVDKNVTRAIVRRASTLKTVAIHSNVILNLAGFVDLITGLCHETSHLEFLSVYTTSLDVSVLISEDEVGRLCSHLMAHAQELSHLKLLHFDTPDPPRIVLNQEGCSVAALKQRLPRPECLVKFEDDSRGYTPLFSKEEKAFVRGLDGYKKTGLPSVFYSDPF